MAEDVTIESVQAELAGAKARLTAINSESQGHRLNWQTAKKEAEEARAAADAAAKKADEAHAAATARIAEIEKATGERVTAAERAAMATTEAARTRSVNADLRIAAKDAGATDLGDVLALLPREKLKINDAGDVENAADLIAEFKKAKPHLFTPASTSNPTDPPPVRKAGQKAALEMTDDEFSAAMKNKGWRT